MMNEDAYLDASWEEQTEVPFIEEQDEYDAELAADEILAQQELEDFEDADDRYGYFDDPWE